MIKIIKPPKFVTKAGQFVVTKVSGGKDKITQTLSWFNTLEEANSFYQKGGE